MWFSSLHALKTVGRGLFMRLLTSSLFPHCFVDDMSNADEGVGWSK